MQLNDQTVGSHRQQDHDGTVKSKRHNDISNNERAHPVLYTMRMYVCMYVCMYVMESNEMEWNGMERNGMEWNGMQCNVM